MKTDYTATPVAFNPDTAQYDHPRQKLYELSVPITDRTTSKYIIVSHSIKDGLIAAETMVFQANSSGDILHFSELDCKPGHVPHDSMIERSPFKLILG